ncbi:MAG: LUD domain-containing protein [Chloroflexi bacterium]|nr:LUD domain-containing protein [Chloroflexota bacterium]
MSNQFFRSRIRESINNETLQIALDNNTERRLKGRALAFESIPDWRERRQRAHKVRADVIDHLDEYLAQFIAKNEENGVIVHRAEDAGEAIQIILQIAQKRGLDTSRKEHAGLLDHQHETEHATRNILIAKSKSMVSEEIELNHALEKERIQVVETDLGEYIVQLRHERPSHIITPAAHLKKEQVAQLFHEKLGIPYTEDIPTLTATARKVLREIFLTADIGFSGVNFGVAETGAVCIITNEGNGRMVTTVPPVHIALMGMERLVPTLDDLSLMLSLLPRSATGQKLTVYTQLLHKPLAHQQRHLIILDNGRTRLRNSPLKESLYCIRCGACLNACPVFRELSGHAYIGKDKSIAPYPGPIGSVISPGLLGEKFVHLAQASSLCGACKDACPVDIDLPKLLTRVRAGEAMEERGKKKDGAGLTWSTKFFLQIYTRLATHPKLFATSQKFAALTSSLLSPRSQWMRVPAFTGWGYSKDLPRFAGQTFRERFLESDSLLSHTRGGNKQQEIVETKTMQELAPALQNKVEQFTKELTALDGYVYQTQTPTQAIIEFLLARKVQKIHLEPNTLDESLLQKANIDFTHEPDPEVLVGVTNAICGLADTGSVLEADGALHASLLPEIHIAVLKSKDILPSLPDAMDLVKDKNSAVFITGPSRTADIEMTLTIGVHGPKEIHVFVDDSNSG